jgi:hypothetical protein
MDLSFVSTEQPFVEPKALCYCWSSVFGKGCSWDTKHLSVVVDQDEVVKGLTNRQIVSFLNWSARSMLLGTFPVFMSP